MDTQEEPWCRPEHPQVKFEAVELRDGEPGGISGPECKQRQWKISIHSLADAIIGENALNQAWIDQIF